MKAVITPPTESSKLAMSFAAKVVRVWDQSGSLVDGIHKTKFKEIPKSNNNKNKPACKLLEVEEEDIFHQQMTTEAFMAKLFASISSIKASYAQWQVCQAPYDVEGIQAADRMIVSEFKYLSELKQCHAKDHLDESSSPETALLLADMKEQKFILRTYGITRQKLISQLRLKDSEITFLEEKSDEVSKENKMLEKRMNSNASISVPNSLQLSTLNVNHFRKVLDQTVKHIRRFVRLMIGEMEVTGWDIDAAATAVQPGITFRQPSQKCFALESFVCREMFNGFNYPGFKVHLAKGGRHKKQQKLFLDRFNELKCFKTGNYLSQRPKSTFAKFCCSKYLQLIHQKMESSLFGDLNQRRLVIGGDHHPETSFYAAFSEMAKRVWLLHCLAFSFEPEAASIFQVAKECRFSDVYMHCVNEEEQAFLSSDRPAPRVAFTVVPGFRVGKTIIQCQVYLCS